MDRVPPLVMNNLYVKFENDTAKLVACTVATRFYRQSAKVDLDLSFNDPKLIWFLLSSPTTYMWNLKWSSKNCKLHRTQNVSQAAANVVLDLWPMWLKIDRASPLIIINLHVRLESNQVNWSPSLYIYIVSTMFHRKNVNVDLDGHIKKNPTKCLWRGSPTVSPTISSSVRLHIYVPSHVLLKYRWLWRYATNFQYSPTLTLIFDPLKQNQYGISSPNPPFTCEVWKWFCSNYCLYRIHKVLSKEWQLTVTFDPWPKINMVPSLTIHNLVNKFESDWTYIAILLDLNCSLYHVHKVLCTVPNLTLTFDPETQNQQGPSSSHYPQLTCEVLKWFD